MLFPDRRDSDSDSDSENDQHDYAVTLASVADRVATEEYSVDDYHAKRPRFRAAPVDRSVIKFELLEIYKALFGDLKISFYFKVPDDTNWPQISWGYKLGRHLDNIRRHLRKGDSPYKEDQVSKLFEMGFVLDERYEADNKYTLAFQTYKEKFGDCDVSRSFVIEDDDETWPEEVRGIKLGRILRNIRYNNAHQKIQPQLAAMGVEVNPPAVTERLTFEQIFELLLAFRTVNGHVNIPKKFEIAQGDENYPEFGWGHLLGSTLHHIRHSKSFSAHMNEFVKLGVHFGNTRIVKKCTYEQVYGSLAAYKALQGDLRVPQKYEVPYDDPRFPADAGGMKLGRIVYGIRSRGSYCAEHREELEQLGVFDF